MITTTDLRTLHTESVHTATTFISWIRPRDLSRRSPCRGWDLAQLLAHMVGQNRGFAKAVRTGRASKDDHLPQRFTPQAWEDSAYDLLEAIDLADPQATIMEPELHAARALPLDAVVGAQLLDTVVHTWDVARSLDLQYIPTRDIASAVLEVAATVPDAPWRKRSTAPFAPAKQPPVRASEWERALAHLGRDPHA